MIICQRTEYIIRDTN